MRDTFQNNLRKTRFFTTRIVHAATRSGTGASPESTRDTSPKVTAPGNHPLSRPDFVMIYYRSTIRTPIATWSRHPWYWRCWLFAPASATTPRACLLNVPRWYLYNNRIWSRVAWMRSCAGKREFFSGNLLETVAGVVRSFEMYKYYGITFLS